MGLVSEQQAQRILGEKRHEIESFYRDVVGRDSKGYMAFLKLDPDADEVKELKRIVTEDWPEMDFSEFKEAVDMWVDMNKKLIRRYLYWKKGMEVV